MTAPPATGVVLGEAVMALRLVVADQPLPVLVWLAAAAAPKPPATVTVMVEEKLLSQEDFAVMV